MDTIFALSSGRPPAAIAIMRVSGPAARAAGAALLGGRLPPPRRATVRAIMDGEGVLLDRGLALWFPGPKTATGEDLLELHLHGGRAIVDAVAAALGAIPGLRAAEPGEFTRRALINGRIDLAQAGGLADLLEAETQAQRRAALGNAEGMLSQRVTAWMDVLAGIAAQIEAAIDFDDEADVIQAPVHDLATAIAGVASEMEGVASRPTVERVRQGLRIVLAGPPNAGKSSLFNALIERDAAIVSPIAGTTRDCIEATVRRGDAIFTLVDTAGVHADSADPIERIGMDRAERARISADALLWLDDMPPSDERAIWIWARCEGVRSGIRPAQAIGTSINDGGSIDALWAALARRAEFLDGNEEVRVNDSQREAVIRACADLSAAIEADDLLLQAELVRRAMRSIAEILGVDATEAMLDALFRRFCIGK